MRRKIKEILRVNHAGESAAIQIYRGQVFLLGESAELLHMIENEKEHLEFFEDQIHLRETSRSKLLKFWNLAGWSIGFVSAAMGEKYAMMCTESVEEVISDHYKSQEKDLNSLFGEEEDFLKQNIKRIRIEEENHGNIAADFNNKKMEIFSSLIKCGCKIAIKIAKKI